MQTQEIRINIKDLPDSSNATGIYLRWYFNGWHYFNFTNGYEITMKTESKGTQVVQKFSLISKIERPTKLKSSFLYHVYLEGISPDDIPAFVGLLNSEEVYQYENSIWHLVDLKRTDTNIRDEMSPAYILDFEISRKEIPLAPSVYQKNQFLYVGDTLCDLDDDEIIAINKQVNNIAELQDRQADFTAEFKIRRTRTMRALFELTGEPGANTTFPYRNQVPRLIQDSITIIPTGKLIVNNKDDDYYHVSIYSGNSNFFTAIEKLKLIDLLLTGANHTWDAATAAASHASDLDYLYPLCEPTDDGGAAPLTDTGSRVDLYAGWIWPFVKMKTIWTEIFTAAGYTVKSNKILASDYFAKLFMPIVSREATNFNSYLFSMWWRGDQVTSVEKFLGEINFVGVQVLLGDFNFKMGYYYAPYTATYRLTLHVASGSLLSPAPTFKVYVNSTLKGEMIMTDEAITERYYEYEVTDVIAGDTIRIYGSATEYFYWSWGIKEISSAKIEYSSFVEPRLFLPDMSQTEFIKMVCNLFALVPDVDAKTKTIDFWNFSELYDNIGKARDWSDYLSETDDSVEFKFGEYAQNNYLKYKDSDDVTKNAGRGNMQIDDDTLDYEKDIIELPVSTCDQNRVLTNVDVSRIGFNKWNSDDSVYEANDSIDPRIVYIKSADAGKTFGLRETAGVGGTVHDVTGPKIASSREVSFSYHVEYYAFLSRLLTKTNLPKAKFNLPVFEVAGLQHKIPIYLRQFKAYYYVNKISNYVPGTLCTVEIIRL